MSAEEIEKGTRWESNVAVELETSNFDLLCMTPENLSAPWIYFEAGALAKVVEHSRVAPILFQLRPSDIQGPLTQFQAVTLTDQDDMMRLLKSINPAAGNEARAESYLEKAFIGLWNQLDAQITALPEPLLKPDDVVPSAITMQPIIEEILVLTRQQSQVIVAPDVQKAMYKLLSDQLVVMRNILNTVSSESLWDELSEQWTTLLEAWATLSATTTGDTNYEEALYLCFR
jgi:hypothetical protein